MRRRGDSCSAGFSERAQILLMWLPPSANEADSGGAFARSAGSVVWEKDEEKTADWAEVGGRKGEWLVTAPAPFLSASGPGTEGRPEKDADKGEGRLGEDEKAAMGDRPNPAGDPPRPAEGGPKGSRMGDDERRC